MLFLKSGQTVKKYFLMDCFSVFKNCYIEKRVSVSSGILGIASR